MASLTRVDKLEFLILVDNGELVDPSALTQVIERLARLPPGFQHELPQHLGRLDAPKDELTGLPVSRFEDMCCGAHGLSILLTTTIGDQSYNVLFDAGPEGLSIDRNVAAMKTQLGQLDALVLSHWHRDHSGGILRALEMRNAQSPNAPPLPVDLHPDRPIRRGLAPGPKYIPTTNFLPDPSFDEIAAANGKVDLHAEAHEIRAGGESTGVGVSGEIPRVHLFEKGLPGAVTWMEEEGGDAGWITDEQLLDERYLAVDVKGKGLVIFSACSHAGICNVVTDAVSRFDRPVHMVVGGLHLEPTVTQPVDETVDFLCRRVVPKPEWVLPLHCTGMMARGKLITAFGNGCVPAGVGIRTVVQGEQEKEAGLDAVEVKIVK